MSKARAATWVHVELIAVPALVILLMLAGLTWLVSSGPQALCEPGQLLWASSRKPPMEIVVDGKLIHIISWSSHDGYMCLDTMGAE